MRGDAAGGHGLSARAEPVNMCFPPLAGSERGRQLAGGDIVRLSGETPSPRHQRAVMDSTRASAGLDVCDQVCKLNQ